MNNSAIQKAATKEAVINNKLKELESNVSNVKEIQKERVERVEVDDDDMVAKWREKRAKQLKKMKDELREFAENGHGQLDRVGSEADIVKLSQKTERIVCHISQDDFIMCQSVENALKKLAKSHFETKFVSIDAMKAPFFTEKLAIRILPTIICILNGKVEDIIIGFDRIGGVKLDLNLLQELLITNKMLRPQM